MPRGSESSQISHNLSDFLPLPLGSWIDPGHPDVWSCTRLKRFFFIPTLIVWDSQAPATNGSNESGTTPVVDFDQLSGAAHTQKLVESLFLSCVHFQTFFLDFRREITEKVLKLTKKVENGSKKTFWPALGYTQHPKAGHNTTQFTTPARPENNSNRPELGGDENSVLTCGKAVLKFRKRLKFCKSYFFFVYNFNN